jgi:2-phospho-L-lactate guanylyltransferase (CobY/MobA/RfbA family)
MVQVLYLAQSHLLVAVVVALMKIMEVMVVLVGAVEQQQVDRLVQAVLETLHLHPPARVVMVVLDLPLAAMRPVQPVVAAALQQ